MSCSPLRSLRSKKQSLQTGFLQGKEQCPRHESNVRTRFRKPLLYPLSYGGGEVTVAPSRAPDEPREV